MARRATAAAADILPAAPSHALLQVQYLPLRDLVPYARNARRHTPAQIAKIKASLMEFGWANTMLVADRGMIAGHARLAAALELRAEDKIIPYTADPDLGPTIDLSHLSVPQRRAFVLADNRLAEEAAWDLDLLRGEFEDLMTNGSFEIAIAGFNPGEINTIMHGWTPDFTKHEGTEAALDPLMAYLRIKCRHADQSRLMTALGELLAQYPDATVVE